MIRTVDASVIMTVYNAEPYISAAIESIKNQTVENLEFIIVNDGSTDNTNSILMDARNDPRIKVITTERLGRARSLNIAWRNTQGAYVANLDADDLAELNRIEKQVNFLKSNSDVGLLGTGWKYFVDNHPQQVRVVQPLLLNEELKRALIRRYPFCHSSAMFTRRSLEKVNGYNENYEVCIDYEISTRIACQYEVANLPDILVWKRTRPKTFFSQVSAWKRYRAVVKIRWLAWATFSGKINELPYVFNGWGVLRQALGRERYSDRVQSTHMI